MCLGLLYSFPRRLRCEMDFPWLHFRRVNRRIMSLDPVVERLMETREPGRWQELSAGSLRRSLSQSLRILRHDFSIFISQDVSRRLSYSLRTARVIRMGNLPTWKSRHVPASTLFCWAGFKVPRLQRMTPLFIQLTFHLRLGIITSITFWPVKSAFRGNWKSLTN